MTISAGSVRYIKLGAGGRWVDASLDRGELHFGYGKSPHELALGGNFDALKQHLFGLGKDAQGASREAREVLDFYELGDDCLWITFARDHLWWTFANPGVTWVGGDGQLVGERLRKSIDGWRNTDANVSHSGRIRLVRNLPKSETIAGPYARWKPKSICCVASTDSRSPSRKKARLLGMRRSTSSSKASGISINQILRRWSI